MERPIRTNAGSGSNRAAAKTGSGKPPATTKDGRILTEAEAARRAAKKEAAREERRRKKRRKRIIKTVLLSVLAVLLIVAAGFTGMLIYLQGQTGEYDDIAQCVQAPAMDYTSRYSFSAVDNTISMKLDKNDLWWLLYQTGAISRLEQVDAKLAANDMRLTGMGISTQGSALAVDVEIAVVGNITLPMTAYCAVDFAGEDIVFSVSELKLGNGWPGPLKWLCRRCDVDPSALTLSISKSIHPMLGDIRSIRPDNGHLVLTCGADRYIYAEALENTDAVQELKTLGVENEAVDVVLEHGVSTAAYDKVFTNFQLLPDSYVPFRSDALALADSAVFTEYFTGGQAVYLQRFIPALTLEAVGAANQELYGALAGRNQLLEALATSLNTAYIRGTVAEPAPPQPEPSEDQDEEDGEDAPAPTLTAMPAAEFLNHAITGSPELTMEQLAGNSWAEYSGWISEGDMRAVYLSGFPETTVERPAPQEEQSEDEDEDEDAPAQPATVTTPAKPIGLLVRLGDGAFRLYYHLAALNGNQVTYTLTQTELDAGTGESCLSSPLIPTVTYQGQAGTPEGVIEFPVDIPVAPESADEGGASGEEGA